jgi:hypothetical protein
MLPLIRPCQGANIGNGNKAKAEDPYEIRSEDERQLDIAEKERENMSPGETQDDAEYEQQQRRYYETEENKEARFRKRWRVWDESRVYKK